MHDPGLVCGTCVTFVYGLPIQVQVWVEDMQKDTSAGKFKEVNFDCALMYQVGFNRGSK